MRNSVTRVIAKAGCVAVIVVAAGAAGVGTQGTAPATPPTARASVPAQPVSPVGRAATRVAGPRTPWGDPDLQGNYTTIAETNTPLERPAELEGKRPEDFTPEEVAKIGKERNEQAIEGYAGQPAKHWFDNMIPNKNSRPWLLTDPRDGRIPPLTTAAAARGDSGRYPDDPATYTDMPQFVRCIATGPPIAQALPMIYSNSFEILQTKDYVAIRHEIIHERRIIPIEGRGAGRVHNPSVLRAYYGDSIARWDGPTLVVDTTNYHPALVFRESTGGTLHTIERFTRTGPKQVEWAITVDDPQTWTRPWSYAIPMHEDDGQAIIEYACHETNMALRNALAGARAKEAKEKGRTSGTGAAR